MAPRLVLLCLALTFAALAACPGDREYFETPGFDADVDLDADGDSDVEADAAPDSDDGGGMDGDAPADAEPDAPADAEPDAEPDGAADGAADGAVDGGDGDEPGPGPCGADGVCDATCPAGTDPDCPCGHVGVPCCETGDPCAAGELCVDDRGPPTCYEACTPTFCDYGGDVGYCLPISASLGLCAAVAMAAVDCEPGRGCRTEYGVMDGTLCVAGAGGVTFCYELCPIEAGECAPPNTCQHVSLGGACMPM